MDERCSAYAESPSAGVPTLHVTIALVVIARSASEAQDNAVFVFRSI